MSAAHTSWKTLSLATIYLSPFIFWGSSRSCVLSDAFATSSEVIRLRSFSLLGCVSTPTTFSSYPLTMLMHEFPVFPKGCQHQESGKLVSTVLPTPRAAPSGHWITNCNESCSTNDKAPCIYKTGRGSGCPAGRMATCGFRFKLYSVLVFDISSLRIQKMTNTLQN